jgi:hypothetical protein
MLEDISSQDTDTQTEHEQDTDASTTTKFIPKFSWCYDSYWGWFYC